jgi:hypothetical protein
VTGFLAPCSVAVGTYGKGMARAVKTTVYLDEEHYEHIKDIARAEGRAPAELVREALVEYAERKRPRRIPRSIGVGHSRKGNVAERAQELLAGMGGRR